MTSDYLILFIFGLIIGSFLNVVILRFDEFETIFYTRSRCPHCRHGLYWYDLIPLFSFLLLRGQCRYCKKPISWQYPLVELLTGLIFAFLYWRFGLGLELAVHLIIASILIVVFVYDILNQLISDSVIWVALGIWIIWLFISNYPLFISFLPFLYGGLALAGFFGLIVFVSREQWMGWGDVFLGFLLGLMVGWPLVLATFFFSFVAGGLVGSILILLKKKGGKDHLPFAPFLIFGTYFTLILSNYLNLNYWLIF